jgi:proteasome alpha subunit
MSMPFYVAPEQQMKDRADFARKGIGRGRSVIVMHYADGILFVAENRSQALHKVSEIYDRIGFAAVGRYNEFENLRQAGIRYADLRGYSYDRTDVTGRGLANAYAQLLGTIFSSGGEKPYEVEIIVAELGAARSEDQIYRLTYDGSVGDEQGFAVMGGSADVIAEVVGRGFQPDLSLADAARLAVQSLGSDGGPNAEPRTLGVEALEVAILDRGRTLPRKFRRIRGDRLAALLSDQVPPEDRGHEAPAAVPPQPAMAETDLTGPTSTSTGQTSAGQAGAGETSSAPGDVGQTSAGETTTEGTGSEGTSPGPSAT